MTIIDKILKWFLVLLLDLLLTFIFRIQAQLEAGLMAHYYSKAMVFINDSFPAINTRILMVTFLLKKYEAER